MDDHDENRTITPRRSGVQTVKRGEIYFERGHPTATVLKIRLNLRDPTPEDWKHVCQRVWKMLSKVSKLKPPGLIISVYSDTDKPALKSDLDEIIQQSLINASTKTDAWIITGGTPDDKTELVGEALQEYRTALTEKDTDAPTLIGIASADLTAGRDVIRRAMRFYPESTPIHYKIDPMQEHPNLDPNHSYFLLVAGLKDEEEDRAESITKTFRSEFEKYIAQKSLRDDPTSASERCDDTPRVSLVLGHGMGTLDILQETLKNQCPVILVTTSQPIADLLSVTKSLNSDSLRKKTKLRIQQKEDALKTARHSGVSESELENVKEKIVRQVNGFFSKDSKGLLTVFDPERDDLAKQIVHVALAAVLQPRDQEENAERRNTALSLAIRWHCWDYAKEHLLPCANQPLQEPERFLFDALVQDQGNIVDYLLQHRQLKIHSFLTKECLEKLYEKGKKTLKELLRYCGYFCKKYKNKTFSLGYINKLLVHLMRDNCFAFYPVVKKESLEGNLPENNMAKVTFGERDLFLWAILTDRPEMSLLFWRRGVDHLGAALFASAMLKRLSSIAEGTEFDEISTDLNQRSEHWEGLAMTLLTECFERNREMTHRLLVRRLTRWRPADLESPQGQETLPGCGVGSPCNARKLYNTPSVLLMAERYKMMKFAGHPACQTKLTAIWKGRMAGDTHELLILLCMFLPFFLPFVHFRNSKSKNRVSSNDSADNGSPEPSDENGYECLGRGLCDLLYLYHAPVTKFFANIVATLVYLALFSYFLIVEFDEGPPTVLEYVTWAWLFSMMLEEARQALHDRRSLRFRLLGWLSFDWNQFDLTLYLVFILTIVLRFSLPAENFFWARWCYSVTLVLCFIRFTQFFYGVKSIGPKVIMIQKMVKDVFLFLAVLVAFVIGFGVAYHVNMFPRSPPDWRLLVNILYYPYFQIFGELNLDDLKGETGKDCTRNETLWRQDPLRRCPEDIGYIVHLMLAAYLIITNILLVNLLIAMFSHTFYSVQQKSLEVWCFYRLTLVHEYFSRPLSVHPFNVFNYMVSIIRYCFFNRSKDCCKDYDAFKRPYDEKPDLTLFEKSAVKKVFFKLKQVNKKPRRVQDVVNASAQP